MSIVAEIKGLFTREAIGASLSRLPPLKTTIIDDLFPGVKEYTTPAVPLGDFQEVVGTIPFVRRGGQPVSIGGGSSEAYLVVPRPFMPSTEINAAELNDLKIILQDQVSRESFINRKVDLLRKIVRASSEAVAAVMAVTGKISWPSQLDNGGHKNFEVWLGEVLSYAPPKRWSSSDIGIEDIFDQLSDAAELIEESCGGSEISFLAGKQAFNSLLKVARNWNSTIKEGPMDLKVEENLIRVGGYKIRRMAERYKNPLNPRQLINKLPPDSILGYASDNPGTVMYPAIDSFSNNNRPSPFHIFVEQKGDTVIKLTAQAKPMPVRNPKSLLLAKVTA